MTYPKLLQSSVNPNELSLTVKGMLIGLVPLALWLLNSYGFSVTETQLVNIIEIVTQVIASVVVIAGLFRKLVVALKLR